MYDQLAGLIPIVAIKTSKPDIKGNNLTIFDFIFSPPIINILVIITIKLINELDSLINPIIFKQITDFTESKFDILFKFGILYISFDYYSTNCIIDKFENKKIEYDYHQK